MNKKTNETQLLTEAKAWFKQKYQKPPKECGIKFIKVWHKPTPLTKTTAVVFAPSEEIGKAFIWEQNAIFRAMGNFWIAAGAFSVFTFASITALSHNDTETAMAIAVIFTTLCFCALLLMLYLAKKCKKLEKIHKWNVEVYYSK